MANFEQVGFRLPGALPPTGRRAEAEAYAASLGMTRGTPGWGDAVRDFVLNRPRRLGVAAGLPGPDAGRLSPVSLGIPPTAGLPAAFPAFEIGADLQTAASPGSFSSIDDELPGYAPAGAGSLHALAAAGRPRASPVRKPRPPAWPRPLVQEPRDPSPRGDGTESLFPPSDPEDKGLVTGVRMWDPPKPARPRGLPSGILAEEEEVRGRGPGIVSSGRGDPGGPSAGPFQLSLNSGNLEGFVNSRHGMMWQRELGGLDPEGPLFKQRWAMITARDGAAFREAQQVYVAEKNYLPLVEAVWKETGLDLNRRSNTVREAVWSASLQHGGASSFLPGAIIAADRRVRIATDGIARISPDYDRVLIEEMYRERIEYTRRVMLSKTDPDEKRTLNNAMLHRLPRERQRALRMLREERNRR